MKDFQIEIDCKQIHAVECGETSHPLVVCLHGLTNNALGFTEMANALKEKFHVISIDLPGHGKTQSFQDEHSYSFVVMFEWLNKVITSITRSPVYLLGHSRGAAIALHYSGRYQRMADGVTMLDGGYTQPSDDSSTTLEEELSRFSLWVNENRFNTIEEYENKKQDEIGRWSADLKEMVHADMDFQSSLVKMRANEAIVRASMSTIL